MQGSANILSSIPLIYTNKWLFCLTLVLEYLSVICYDAFCCYDETNIVWHLNGRVY